jgi:threonine dehydrogenase-like Zn-dependent dehydrogenase
VTEVDFHDEVHTFGLHIIGAHNSTHTPVETPYNVWTLQRDRELFLDLVAAGEVRVADLITHRFPWQEAPAAFRALWEDRTRFMGAILDWTR